MTAVYASTACVDPGRDLWATLARCRAAGLGRVELGSARVEPDEGLARRLRGERLELLVHNYFPPPPEPFVLNLASPDERVRARSLDHVRTSIELSVAIGAPFYSVHAGFVHDPVGFAGGSFVFPDATPADVEAAAERFRSALATALGWARAAGIDLLVENNVCTVALRGKLLLQTADEFEQLLADVDDPRCRILVDTGHLNVSAHTLGFDREEFVARLEPHVGAVHLHDNGGVVDEHSPVEPGSWALRCVQRPALRGVAVVVEARFATFEALAGHVRWLEKEL